MKPLTFQDYAVQQEGWQFQDSCQAALGKAMRAVCASDERTRFLDVWPLMTDDAGNVRDDMYAADGGVLQEYDGIHMNALGYSAWTAELRALLDELLT